MPSWRASSAPPMVEILVRPEAETDIEGIADETIERWGREQARSYVAAVRADITSLAKFPNRFPIHEQTALGLRRMRSGHHLAFYLVGEEPWRSCACCTSGGIRLWGCTEWLSRPRNCRLPGIQG